MNEVDSEPIFSEYQKRNLQSLLWELLSRAKNDDVVNLRSAFKASVALVAHREQNWEAYIEFWDGEVRYDGKRTSFKKQIGKPETIIKNLIFLNDEILPPLRWLTTKKTSFNPNKALQLSPVNRSR